jgi:hypothetical protein
MNIVRGSMLYHFDWLAGHSHNKKRGKVFQEYYVDIEGPLNDNPTLPNLNRSRERQGPRGRWYCQRRLSFMSNVASLLKEEKRYACELQCTAVL